MSLTQKLSRGVVREVESDSLLNAPPAHPERPEVFAVDRSVMESASMHSAGPVEGESISSLLAEVERLWHEVAKAAEGAREGQRGALKPKALQKHLREARRAERAVLAVRTDLGKDDWVRFAATIELGTPFAEPELYHFANTELHASPAISLWLASRLEFPGTRRPLESMSYVWDSVLEKAPEEMAWTLAARWATEHPLAATSLWSILERRPVGERSAPRIVPALMHAVAEVRLIGLRMSRSLGNVGALQGDWQHSQGLALFCFL